MNEKHFAAFTFTGLMFCSPFLISIINPPDFIKNTLWPPIFLGMAIYGLTLSVFFGVLLIVKLFPDTEKQKGITNKS